MTAHGIGLSEFADRLGRAAQAAIDFARGMVVQQLPSTASVLVAPNQSNDWQLLDDEEIFRDDVTVGSLGPLTYDDAARWLWRDGKIPAWINVRVYDVRADCTTVLLECCGRFTAMIERLYHRERGIPPFHIMSPVLPPGWRSVAQDGRFMLIPVPPPRNAG